MQPHPHRSRSFRTLLLLPLLGLLAAACGGDDGAAGNDDGAEPTASVTIEHADGSTTIDETPERIVTLGLQWTDAVLAFDLEPVGYATDPLAGDSGVYPWNAELLADATGIDVTDGLPLEQIAALDPDLILVVPYLLSSEGQYDTLSDIAPTIAAVTDAQVDKWQDQVDVIGRILDRSDDADAVVAEIDELVAATAAQYPGLAGKSFALANHVPGDALYVVADDTDGSSVFFQDLGMRLPPELLAAADGVTGRAKFSLEQVELLAADLLVLFNNDGQPTDLVGYERLPAVQDGAVSNIDYISVVGLNTPTPLSIPYSLEVVRPALEAAAT